MCNASVSEGVSYRAIHSTETAITAVYDEIVRAVDSGDVCVLVLHDLGSAFDTVDHNNVNNKVNGSDSMALCWINTEITCVVACRPCRSGHCYLDHTTSTTMCYMCLFLAQRSSSHTPRICQMFECHQSESSELSIVRRRRHTTGQTHPSHGDCASHRHRHTAELCPRNSQLMDVLLDACS